MISLKLIMCTTLWPSGEQRHFWMWWWRRRSAWAWDQYQDQIKIKMVKVNELWNVFSDKRNLGSVSISITLSLFISPTHFQIFTLPVLSLTMGCYIHICSESEGYNKDFTIWPKNTHSTGPKLLEWLNDQLGHGAVGCSLFSESYNQELSAFWIYWAQTFLPKV